MPCCWVPQSTSCDSFPAPWKSKRAIKITGVWRPHDSPGTNDNVTLLHGLFFKATAASYAISEALMYGGASLCLALKLWPGIDAD